MKIGISLDQYLIVINTLNFLKENKDFLLIPEIQKLQSILEVCEKDVIIERLPNNAIRRLLESLINSKTFLTLTYEQTAILYSLSVCFELDRLENSIVTFER